MVGVPVGPAFVIVVVMLAMLLGVMLDCFFDLLDQIVRTRNFFFKEPERNRIPDCGAAILAAKFAVSLTLWSIDVEQPPSAAHVSTTS